jgi:hypothetical protein
MRVLVMINAAFGFRNGTWQLAIMSHSKHAIVLDAADILLAKTSFCAPSCLLVMKSPSWLCQS